MIKKAVSGIIVLLTFLIITACSSEEITTNNNVEDLAKNEKLLENPDNLYIGFAIDTLLEERWFRDKEAFENAVIDLGGEVKTLAANGNQEVQIQQAKLLIQEGVDVLVVVPTNAEGASEIVTIAHEADVQVISYDRLILGADVDYYMSFDNIKVGELQAEEILKEVDKGTFAYVGGAETDNNALLLQEGAMNVLKPYLDSGDIDLVYNEFTPEWDPDTAQSQLEAFLSSSGVELEAVIAANDGTAGGVVQALGDSAGDIPLSGQDAELAGVRRIVDGTQTMTVYKSIQEIANQAAALAMSVAAGETIETDTVIQNGYGDIPAILLDPVTVTENTIREIIIGEGHLDEEDIYE